MTAYNLSARVDGGHVNELEDGIGLWCDCLFETTLGVRQFAQGVYNIYIYKYGTACR